MPDLSALMRAHGEGLIDGTYGCLDAAASQVNARLRTDVAKGSLSRWLHGDVGLPVGVVIALEDGARRYPFTDLMVRRRNPDQVTAGPESLMDVVGEMSKEFGEAVQQIIAAERSNKADDRAKAIKEIDEAIEALQRGRAKMVAC